MKIKIVLLDETQNWAEVVTKPAGKVFGVYYYDPSIIVHCCELTPSYELTPLNSVPEHGPEDDEAREKLLDDIMSGDSNCNDIKYIHCHTLDALHEIKRGELKEGQYTHPNDFESDEEVEEHWSGNPDY